MPILLRALLGGLLAQLSAAALAAESTPPLEVKGRLDAMQTAAHRLDTVPGDFVQGSLDGLRMRLVLIDGDGKRERILAKGEREQQDFMFVTGANPPYALEVRAPEGGAYTLRVGRVVPKDAQVPPPVSLDSPRLRALADTLAAGGGTAAFWSEVQALGTPLVESDGVEPPLTGGQKLVTFLWRGASHGVRLFGAPSGDHDELQRLGQSDVWYRSYRLPADTRLSYRLAPDVPELNADAGTRRRAILATAQHDPFNPRTSLPKPLDKYDGDSVFELPGAPPQPWIEKRPDMPAGKLEPHRFTSAVLGNTRDIFLYRPHLYRPGAAENTLLVAFDAESYTGKIPTPTILDNLIAAGKIPSMAAIIIGNPSNHSRAAELPPNPDFARFLAEELMPWAKAQGVTAPAARTVIAGSSFGGLASAYAGFSHPEWFGNVYSQSGSFWWAPPGEEQQWLTRQFAAQPLKPLRFHLEAGLFETNRQGGILETSRNMRDVLRAKGYDVQYREYASGHDYLNWRGTLATGLIALLGNPER